MNILKLINKLNSSHNIEWKKIKEIGFLYSGLHGKSKKDFEDGNFKYVTYMNVFKNLAIDLNDFNKVKVNNNEKQNSIKYGDVIFTGSSELLDEVGITSVVNTNVHETIYLNSFCFGLRMYNLKIFNIDFLKFLFTSNEMRRKIKKCSNGVTRINLSKKQLEEITIPIPPLEFQNEIVRILDKYTELEKELEKELELRTKQYEYYRDKLFLDLYKKDNIIIEPLWKVTNWNKKFTNVEKVKQQKITKFKSVSAKKLKELNIENGNIKLLSTGLFDGYTNKELASDFISSGEVITLPEGGNANIKYWNGEFVNSLNLVATSSNNDLYSLKFIYYFLIFKNKWIENRYRGSNVKHPNMLEILELKIPIPSFKEQQKIVDILDKFTKIINNIKEGLPKEIELRYKQYLYFRNNLLNFAKEIYGKSRIK